MVEDLIIKDRRHLSEDGIVLPIIAINKLSGRVETSPEIVTRGFDPGEDGLMDGARQIVMETLEHSSEEEKADYGVIKEKIRADLKRYISKQTQKTAADHAGNSGDLAEGMNDQPRSGARSQPTASAVGQKRKMNQPQRGEKAFVTMQYRKCPFQQENV